MRATVRAVPPDEFEAWAEQKREDIQAAGEALAEQREAARARAETEGN